MAEAENSARRPYRLGSLRAAVAHELTQLHGQRAAALRRMELGTVRDIDERLRRMARVADVPRDLEALLRTGSSVAEPLLGCRTTRRFRGDE